MGSYRSRLDIVADVLDVVSRRAKKTQIMNQANLNYRLLCRYLGLLRRACLVRFERRERCYVLTSKGVEFLEKYGEYARRNRHVELQVSRVQSERRLLEELCSSK